MELSAVASGWRPPAVDLPGGTAAMHTAKYRRRYSLHGILFPRFYGTTSVLYCCASIGAHWRNRGLILLSDWAIGTYDRTQSFTLCESCFWHAFCTYLRQL